MSKYKLPAASINRDIYIDRLLATERLLGFQEGTKTERERYVNSAGATKIELFKAVAHGFDALAHAISDDNLRHL
jgi:hypothetical protein